MKKIFIVIICLICMMSASAFTPQDDINLRNFYAIWNATTITANNFIGTFTGSFTIGQNVDYNGYNLTNATDVCIIGGTCLSNVSTSIDINKTYVDAQDVIYNDSMKVYVDAQDIIYNDSMKVDVDAQDVLYNDSMKVYVDSVSGSDVNKTYVDAQDVIYNDSMKVYTDATFITITNTNNLIINWTQLQNYPTACPSDTYVTTIGDTSTCTGISDVYLLNTGDSATGNYSFTDEITSIQKISFEQDTTNHAITDNSTCVIITGDTSTFNIC